jgi:outer membrane scaffolding protein for murein synthesis (MipA/OmpV family)
MTARGICARQATEQTDMRGFPVGLAAACAGILGAGDALAQRETPFQANPGITAFTPGPDAGWVGHAGGGVLVRPSYAGSGDYQVTPIPALAVTYDDWFFADPGRGIGVTVRPIPGVELSGGANYGFGREEDNDARLTGLGDLNGGIGPFAVISLRPFGGIGQALSFDLRADAPLTGDIGGAEIATDVSVSAPLWGGFVSVSAGAAWMTGEMVDDVFGVTPAQAAGSIFPAYDPDGGLASYRLGFTGVKPLGGRWNAVATGGYERLRGDAGRSPIVEDRNQFRLAAMVMYRFTD